MAGRKNQEKEEEDKNEIIEEVLSEFRYEMESIYDIYDEEAVQEVIETLITEYVGNKNKKLIAEVEELIKEELDIILDESDSEDSGFGDWGEDADEYDNY